MKTSSLWIALSASLTLSLGCGDMLSAEVEVPEVCKTLPDQLFSGAQYSRTMDVNLGQQFAGLDVTTPTGLNGDFNLTKAVFTAKSGISNFDFIDGAQITILPPS